MGTMVCFFLIMGMAGFISSTVGPELFAEPQGSRIRAYGITTVNFSLGFRV